MSKIVVNGQEVDFCKSVTFPIKGNAVTVTFAQASALELENSSKFEWDLTKDLHIISQNITGSIKTLHSVVLKKKVIFTNVTAQGLFQIALAYNGQGITSSDGLYKKAMEKQGLRKATGSKGARNTVITEAGALG